MTQVQI